MSVVTEGIDVVVNDVESSEGDEDKGGRLVVASPSDEPYSLEVSERIK